MVTKNNANERPAEDATLTIHGKAKSRSTAAFVRREDLHELGETIFGLADARPPHMHLVRREHMRACRRHPPERRIMGRLMRQSVRSQVLYVLQTRTRNE